MILHWYKENTWWDVFIDAQLRKPTAQNWWENWSVQNLIDAYCAEFCAEDDPYRQYSRKKH